MTLTLAPMDESVSDLILDIRIELFKDRLDEGEVLETIQKVLTRLSDIDEELQEVLTELLRRTWAEGDLVDVTKLIVIAAGTFPSRVQLSLFDILFSSLENRLLGKVQKKRPLPPRFLNPN